MSKKLISKHCASWEAFTKYVGLIQYDEALELGIITPNTAPDLVKEIDDYLAIYACSEGAKLVASLAQVHNLQIVTECIHDCVDDKKVAYSFSTGMHFVDRERYYLCHNPVEAYFEEIIDLD